MSDAVIIAHGKSEYDLFYGLIAWTDREPNLFARDGGRRNIAISHLRDVLTDVPFTSEKKLHERYRYLNYRPRGSPAFGDLKIFPVMDYDGDNANVLPYITDNLLCGSSKVPLAGYVSPVLNYPNLEEVMSSIGYDVVGIDKGEFYKELVRGLKRKTDILEFYNKLRDCDTTNMDAVIYHILKDHPSFQSSIKPLRVKSWDFLR